MRRAIVILILCILSWTSSGFIKPAFCHPAEVRDVVFMRFISSTHLNITVWHDIETSLHYVDAIEVTWGTNITSLTIDRKPLAPDGTFTVDYNMGPVSGTPTITVRARCTITGYSGATSWTGTIPEPSPFPSPSPIPTATSTSAPSPTPSVSSSPSPSPTVTPSPSPTATSSPSPSLSPTLQPTVTPESKPDLLLPNEIIYLIIAVIVAAVATVVVLAVAFKRRRK